MSFIEGSSETAEQSQSNTENPVSMTEIIARTQETEDNDAAYIMSLLYNAMVDANHRLRNTNKLSYKDVQEVHRWCRYALLRVAPVHQNGVRRQSN